MSLSIAEAIREASQSLQAGGVPEPRREAGSLLAFVLDKDRTFIISHAEELLSESELNRFRDSVQRRVIGEPQQYITGFQDFFGRTFKVTPDVLIPRPETELLVESAVRLIDQRNGPVKICDVGTGSGCIAITLVCERKGVHAVALDISREALRIAKDNAVTFSVADRISFIQSDCFDAVPKDSRFDLIVSNPPYVSGQALAGLQREVRDHEPLVALSPGTDGLAVIRRLIHESPAFLNPRCHLLLEIGFDQAGAVRQLVEHSTWDLLDILPDLQGIPRLVLLQKSEPT